MPTTGQIVAGSVFAIIAGLGIREHYKKKKKKKKADACRPYIWDPAPVAASIRALLEDGYSDPNEIAAVAANEHFSGYPAGGTATFPPGPSPLAGVPCIWQRTRDLVDALIDEYGVKPQPFEVVEDWTRPDPTPGGLYRVAKGKPGAVSTIAKAALAAAGVPDTINQNNVAVNRVALEKLMECSPWNDALSNLEGMGFKSGPKGRGLNMNAVHADNKQRMMMGQKPRRSMTGPKSHDGTGGHLPFIWIPPIQTNAPVVILADNSDGSPGINPPPEILAFGLENVPPAIYGCEEYKGAAEDLQV